MSTIPDESQRPSRLAPPRTQLRRQPARPIPDESERPSRIAPRKPPVPALQKHGYHGSVDEFAHRLNRLTTVYERRFGYRPSPGLAFDLVKSPVHEDSFDRLFDIPRTKVAARARKANKDFPLKDTFGEHVAETLSPLSQPELDAGLIENFEQALRSGQQASLDFYSEHGAQLNEIARKSRPLAAKIARIKDEAFESAERRGATIGTSQLGVGGSLDLADKIAAKTVLGITQVASGLVLGPPTLALEEGKAVKHSVEQRSLKPLVQTQKELAKAVATGIWEDVRHPGENPGFFFLDILGFASLGAGGIARVSAASKGGSLLRKPVPGTVEYRRGEMVEHELLSENAALRPLQRLKARAANSRVEKRRLAAEIQEDRIPGGIASVARSHKLSDALDNFLDSTVREHLSSEKKIGRLATARRRVEDAVDRAPLRELEFVARATPVRARINQAVPVRLQRGLTVGEQKALQVRFTDLEGDDLAKLGAWRDFHEAMIELGPVVLKRELGLDAKAAAEYLPQFVAEHRAQLQALDLAEKVFQGKQGKRFAKAETLVRELEREAEIRKIEDFGMTVETAEGRVAAAGQVVREKRALDREVDRLPERVSDEAIYTPFKSRAKSRKQTKVEQRIVGGPRQGEFGIPEPQLRRYLPELYTSFTGKSIVKGDFRVDVTNLATEQAGQVFRASAVLTEYRNLLKAATDRPTGSGFDIPIRTERGVPDELRTVLAKIDEGEVGSDEASYLARADHEELLNHLFPGTDPRTGKLIPGASIEGVKYVDSRLVMDRNQVPYLERTGAQRVFQAINEPFRVGFLFLRPAYALNMVGNTGMLLIQQGAWTVPNLARALFAERIYGARVDRALDNLAGQSKSRSFAPSAAPSPGRALARFWNAVADEKFRKAAIIHELQRKGYKGREAFDRVLFDKAHLRDLNEAVQRGDGAMVKFSNLTNFEKGVLRNIVFVYPWVSRSAVWSLRTILEHPVQSDIFAHLGSDAEDEVDEILGKMPEWFRNAGYIPLGFRDGKPVVVNPSSVNSFSTMAQLLQLAEGERPPLDVLGPGAQIALFTATGRDEFGNELPGPWFVRGFGTLVKDLPQYRAWQRGGKAALEKPLPAIDPTDRETLVRRRKAALGQQVLGPGWLNGWGTLITGQLSPREVNQDALFARFWRDLPMEERHKLEMQFIREALDVQAEFLGRKLPDEVTEAVRVVEQFERQKKQVQSDTGKDNLSPREEDDVLLAVLSKQGQITEEQHGRLRKAADGLKGEDEHRDFQQGLLNRYGSRKELLDWDKDVRTVYSFRKEKLQRKLDRLATQGVVSKTSLKNIPQEALFEAGRKYLAFQKDVRQQLDQADLAGTPEERDQAYAELSAWEESQDAPVKVGDTTLPSFVRIQWAYQTEGDKLRTLARKVALRGWDQLSTFDKELLGKKGRFAEAWAVYQGAVTEYKLSQPFDQRTLKADQLANLAKQVNRSYPGFVADWAFNKAPLYQRLQALTVVSRSPNRSDWNWLLSQADAFWQAHRREELNARDMKEQWKDFTRTTRPWIAENLPRFDQELSLYEEQNSSFLLNFVTR